MKNNESNENKQLANQNSREMQMMNTEVANPNVIKKTSNVAQRELNSSIDEYEFSEKEMNNIEDSYKSVDVKSWNYLNIDKDMIKNVEYIIRIASVIKEEVDLVDFDTKKPICDEDGVQMTENKTIVYFYFWDQMQKKTLMKKNYAIYFMLGVIETAKSAEYDHNRGDLMGVTFTGREASSTGKQPARFSFRVLSKKAK